MKFTTLIIAGAAALSMSAVAVEAQAWGNAQSQSQSGLSHSTDTVKQVQEKLSAAGHDAGNADGIMGPKTADALRSFQQAKGLSATGRIDNDTLAALGLSTEGTGGTSSSAGGTVSSQDSSQHSY